MNRIRETRIAARLDISDAAASAGMDVLALAMAERGMGLIHFDTVASLASVFEVSLADLFPDAGEALDALEALALDGSGETLESGFAERLAAQGVDPDPDWWSATVAMSSGAERRYLVDSAERGRLAGVLMAGASPFVSFFSDCRHVLVRRADVAEIRIGDGGGSPRFSSREAAMKVTLLRRGAARAENVDAVPDRENDSPFSAFLEMARAGTPPSFLGFEDHEGDRRFFGVEGLSLVEMPAGLLMPELYTEEDLPADAESADLADMEIKGNA